MQTRSEGKRARRRAPGAGKKLGTRSEYEYREQSSRMGRLLLRGPYSMHRFTSEGRWTAPPGQFAARVAAGSLPGVLSKSLLVDFSIRAVLVEEGEIVGELGPGVHTLDSLAERLSFEPRRHAAVVVFRAEEIPVALADVIVKTRDGQWPARTSQRVRVDDATLFLQNTLGSRDSLRAGRISVAARARLDGTTKGGGRADDRRRASASRYGPPLGRRDVRSERRAPVLWISTRADSRGCDKSGRRIGRAGSPARRDGREPPAA